MIELKETVPPLDENRLVYKFSNGFEMNYEDYWDWRKELRFKEQQDISKRNLEFQDKCIASTELLNDMLSGYAPSIAHSRSARRRRKK